MHKDFERIAAFIDLHHVMSLATTFESEVSVCSLFYTYDADSRSFIVASSDDTLHISHIKKNAAIAGNIVLETDTVFDAQVSHDTVLPEREHVAQ